jgi:adenosylhomocysteine nucleosidase
MRIGIVIALASEANTLLARQGSFLEHAHYQIQVSGPGPLRAAVAAQVLLDAGCDTLLSFGVCGGLDPTLRAGALVIAPAVRSAEGEQLTCDIPLHHELMARLVSRHPHAVDLYSTDTPVRAQADKHALHKRLQVAAVDMESAAIGRVADSHGLPFAVLRSIVDPAGFTLPTTALAGMAEDGRSRPLATAVALLRHPRELPDLIRLALWYGAALRALRSASALLCK